MGRLAFIQVSLNGTDIADAQHKPGTPDEIAADAIACIRAGASVIHSHIDNRAVSGEDGARRYLEGWLPILAVEPDALLFPTVNWGPAGTTNLDHIEPLARSGALRVSFNDLGCREVGRFDHGWLSGGQVYSNDFDTVTGRFAQNCLLKLGTAIHIDGISGLRQAMQRHRAGQLPPGCWLSLYFSPEPVDEGNWPGFLPLPALASALDLCLEIMGDGLLPWSASLWGGDLVGSGFGRLVLERGGHLSVGLEHYRGPRSPTNALLVKEAAALCQGMGFAVADPRATAMMLGLPGRTVGDAQPDAHTQ